MPDYIIGVDMAEGPDMTVITRKCQDCGQLFGVPSLYSTHWQCVDCLRKRLRKKFGLIGIKARFSK